MKFGDQVLIVENGIEYVATVLKVRELADHEGKNGEPLLSLGFFKPVLDHEGNPRSVVGTQEQEKLVQFRYDVVHESHEYSAAYQRKHGANTYQGGRWRELSATEPELDPVEEEQIVAGEPSADDLDAVSDEQKAADETSSAKE